MLSEQAHIFDQHNIYNKIVLQEKRRIYGENLGGNTMKRIVMILLCWGVLSTMTGCYVAPYPYYGGYAGTDVSISVGRGWRGHHHHGNYGGYRYGGYSGYSRWHR